MRARAVIKLSKYVGTFLRIFNQVEENTLVLEIQVAKELGDISGMRLGKEFSQVRESAAPNQTPGVIEQKLLFLIHRSLTSKSGMELKLNSIILA